MRKFKITYLDPDTHDTVTVTEEFEDTDNVSAYEWAKDYAYSVSDKGTYFVSEVL